MPVQTRHFKDQNVDLESNESVDPELMNHFIIRVRPMIEDYEGEAAKNIVLSEWKQFLTENQLG
jgi:hypothetical protein